MESVIVVLCGGEANSTYTVVDDHTRSAPEVSSVICSEAPLTGDGTPTTKSAHRDEGAPDEYANEKASVVFEEMFAIETLLWLTSAVVSVVVLENASAPSAKLALPESVLYAEISLVVPEVYCAIIS